MLSRLRALLSRGESGQAMILVAVMGTALIGITGLAIEGGRILVEQHRMQSAADLAALIGAQAAGCTSTDTTCINLAKQAACNYAQSNGFGGGWDGTSACIASGGSTVTVDIPPATCSPYNLDYGNGKTPFNNCAGTSTASKYDYVEVEITQNLGAIPIFNVSVSPHVHAVARKGTQSPRDYAISVLDPNLAGALTMGGSGSRASLYVVGSVISNSSRSSSITHSGSRTVYTCGGQWETASTSETTPPDSSVKSYSVGSSIFAPPSCSGTLDSTTAWASGQPTVSDPYDAASHLAPPSSNWAACAPCMNSGHYFHWTTSRSSGYAWDERGAGTPPNITKDNWEFFPGIYPSGITINGGNVYFNPGVYTLGTSSTDGTIKIQGANACVFGAPICDRFASGIPGSATATCGTAGMTSSGGTYVDPNVDPSTWYYYCSSWGTWDTTLTSTTGFPSILTSAPTFTTDTVASSTPLNGVTFYGAGGGSGIDIEGSAVMSLAFPNPCPGTGTFTANSNKVPFQSIMGVGSSGSTSATYTYPAGSAAIALGGSPAGEVYPSADLTVDGEATCRGLLNSGNTSGPIPDVWPCEFQAGVGAGNTCPTAESANTGQLLHFIVFLRDRRASVKLAGGGTQLWWGIVYNPGDYATAGGCGASTSGCQISLTGSSGGTNGPPMLVGQVVGDGVNLGGSSTLEVFYRPCDPRSSDCELGPGSSLVQ